jgi:inner membrane protein
MMGKTHVAGALASWALIYPMVVKTPINSTKGALVLGLSLTGTVIAGLFPDIDQPGSTIDQKLFGPLGKTRISAMLGGIFLIVISVCLRRPELMAQLINRPALMPIFGFISWLPVVDVAWISLVLGIIGTCLIIIAILKHRGITHKLIGLGLFLWGVDTLLGFLPIFAPWHTALLILFGAGYLSHLILDLIADGVPLLDPLIKGFIKLPLPIHTGSIWDVVFIRFGLLAYFAFAVANTYLPAAWLAHLSLLRL